MGFNVRRQSGKLLIKPSKAALRRHRQRLRAEMRSLRDHNAIEVLQRVIPIVRGWAAYYRTVVSAKAFSALDRYLWRLLYKWAKVSPKKAKRWIVNRYFARFNRSRNDRWVFGDRNSGAYLVKHAWTRIVRHQMVKSGSSPDDPALAEYWANRQRKTPPHHEPPEQADEHRGHGLQSPGSLLLRVRPRRRRLAPLVISAALGQGVFGHVDLAVTGSLVFRIIRPMGTLVRPKLRFGPG